LKERIVAAQQRKRAAKRHQGQDRCPLPSLLNLRRPLMVHQPFGRQRAHRSAHEGCGLPKRPLGLKIRTTKMIANATVSLRSAPIQRTWVRARSRVTPTTKPPPTAPVGLVKPPRVAEANA